MLDRLFGPETRNFERALGRTSQRHALLTENLANVNVPGYKRKDVDFGIELERAQDAMKPAGLEGLQNRLGSNTMSSQGSVRVDGNSVDMEQEVASIGESELRYEILTDMTSRYFSNLKAVIREGR